MAIDADTPLELEEEKSFEEAKLAVAGVLLLKGVKLEEEEKLAGIAGAEG